MDLPSAQELVTGLVTGTMLGGLFAITALGLSLVFGVMRLINLAYGEILVLGAYLSLELNRRAGLDPLLSILVVAPLMFALAVPLHRLLLEPLASKGPETALMTTFGLSIIAQNLFILAFSGDSQSLDASYGSTSLNVLGISTPLMYVLSFVLALVLCGGVHLLLQRTTLGRDIRSSAEDPVASAALGVNVRAVHGFVFGLAAACAAVGGVLVGISFQFTPTAGTSYLLTGFVVVVLGGLGSVKGTLLGGILLGIVQSVGATFVGDGYRDFIGFAAFLIILSFRPQGLFGKVRFA